MRTQLGLVLIVVLVTTACGDLNEQRANHEKIREGIEQHEIKRVTPDQIIAEAYQRGNQVLAPIFATPSQSKLYWSSSGVTLIDSLNQSNKPWKVVWIPLEQINTDHYSAIQNQILDAYLYSFEQGQPLAENVQTLDEATLWYTKPYSHQDTLQGIWSITLAKRDLIMNL